MNASWAVASVEKQLNCEQQYHARIVLTCTARQSGRDEPRQMGTGTRSANVEVKVDRRSFLIGSAASATALPWALAQEASPTRAITIINPFPPGGASDVVTRPFAAALEPVLHKP